MTNPSPDTAAEMQKRLRDIESRIRYTETELELLDEHAGAKQGYEDAKFMIDYIRTLEKEHREMREAIEDVMNEGAAIDAQRTEGYTKRPILKQKLKTFFNFAGHRLGKVLSSLTLNP